MGEIVNLRRVRKRIERSEREGQAAVNRVAFGAPKVDKELRAAEKALEERRLDSARLDRDDG